LTAQVFREIAEEGLVNQISLRAIRQQKTAMLPKRFDLVLHPYGRCKPAKQKTAWLQNTPSLAQHRLEVMIITRKVEYGTADYKIPEAVGKRHFFYGF
jgi:hypothetical protein